MILPFDKISRNDAYKAGGKWASLGEMTRAGIAIPPGFVVLAETFEEFIDSNNLRAEIQTILEKLDHNNVGAIEHASEKIQELIRGGIISEKIQKELQKYTKTIKTDFVAVRSSATAEDGAEHAWAWQLDTYLNVPKTDIIAKIQSCWASLFTPRALFYRSEKWLQDLHISVAVVVQSMVDADSAGVAFSVHPVTENTDEIVIEWSWWLGEAVVSWEVTPDSFVISKSSWEIISQHIAEKKKGIFRNTNGENEWRTIEKHEQEISILSKDKLSELANLIIKIENHYGFPCDIEWAHSKGEIYILQARPITTLQKNITITQNDNIYKLKNTPFQLDWSGEFSLLNYSFCAKGYFDPFEDIFGKSLNSIYVSYKKGVAHGYLPVDEYQMLGKHLAFLAQNNNFRDWWINNFKKTADGLSNMISSINENNFLSQIQKIQNIYEKYTAYQVASKLVVNFLNITEDSSMFNEFEDARKHSERLFWDIDKIINRIVDEIITKTNYSREQILFTLQDELEGIYANIDAISREDLSQRYERCAVYSNKNGHTLLSSSEAEAIEESWFNQNSNLILEGTVAYPWKVTGRCRILTTYKDAQIDEGDILVTGMTEPEYLPLMKKARAFVTDGGGLLCHAAITARELKKPCMIGTKNATKILKDGDLVEVDAENGVVNILNKIN